MGAPPDSIVGAIVRGDEAIVPGGDTVIRPGDRLLVFAARSEVAKVRDLFKGVTA